MIFSDYNKNLASNQLKIFNSKIEFDKIYVVLFALLLIPKNYRLFFNYYDGVYIDPFIMSIFTFLLIYEEFSLTRDVSLKIIIKQRINYLIEFK